MFGMIAKELLEILVCPACKQALEYRQNPESLKCTACHRVYAVKDDIPIMLVDESVIESALSSADAKFVVADFDPAWAFARRN